jgi:hypothetical protein
MDTRESSRVFRFNPAADLEDGDIYEIDLSSDARWRKYLPFDWLEITNASGYPVVVFTDGEARFTCYGRQVKTMRGRLLTSFKILNDSGSTITSTDIEILIQKGWEK